MKSILTLLSGILVLTQTLTAQNLKSYTTANAHSHNDYEQKRAFYDAYEQQFGSVEADLYLVNDTLFVAHEMKNISRKSTFQTLYLQPLLEKTEKNGGSIYPEKNQVIQLLIDLKTSGDETLAALVKELDPHKDLLAPAGSVKIVISGNVPDPASFEKYPSYIFFDGRPEIPYTPAQLARVGLISQSFQTYSRWNGEGPLPENQKKKVNSMIGKVHDMGKKVRLWATPDNINSWKTMMGLGVDYLNTDKVREMGDYLRTAPR